MKNKPKNIPSPYKFAGTKIFRDTTALPFVDGGPLRDRNITSGKLLQSTYASALGNMFREGGPFGENKGAFDYATSVYAPELGNYYNQGGLIKRADGSYSQRGLWDNIRANAGSGKQPTAAMLAQEKKINNTYRTGGQFPTPYSLPEDSFKQGGRNLHNSIYASSSAQYPAVYKNGGGMSSHFYASNVPDNNISNKDLTYPENSYVYAQGGDLNNFQMNKYPDVTNLLRLGNTPPNIPIIPPGGGETKGKPTPISLSKLSVNDTTALIYNTVLKNIEKAKAEGRIGKDERLDPMGVTAQILLESGNAKSGLTSKYNNFGGLRATPGFIEKGGKTVEMLNKASGKKFLWRAYDTPEEGLAAQVDFYLNNPRYRKAGVFNATSPKEHLDAVYKAGYAGKEKGYVDSVMRMVNSIPNRLKKANSSVLSSFQTAPVPAAPTAEELQQAANLKAMQQPLQRMEYLRPQLIPATTKGTIPEYEGLQAPSYGADVPLKDRYGFIREYGRGKGLYRWGNKYEYTPIVPKIVQGVTGFDKDAMLGYSNSEGDYIPGEIESAQNANRRIDFQGAGSLQDIRNQNAYNKEYDQYEQDLEKQNFYQPLAGSMGNILKREGGSININPANKGKFTASANAAGMGVQEFASHVLANKDNYSSTQVKRANFAHNAAGWKHQYGGHIMAAGGWPPGWKPRNPQLFTSPYYSNLTSGVTAPSWETGVQYTMGKKPKKKLWTIAPHIGFGYNTPEGKSPLSGGLDVSLTALPSPSGKGRAKIDLSGGYNPAQGIGLGMAAGYNYRVFGESNKRLGEIPAGKASLNLMPYGGAHIYTLPDDAGGDLIYGVKGEAQWRPKIFKRGINKAPITFYGRGDLNFGPAMGKNEEKASSKNAYGYASYDPNTGGLTATSMSDEGLSSGLKFKPMATFSGGMRMPLSRVGEYVSNLKRAIPAVEGGEYYEETPNPGDFTFDQRAPTLNAKGNPIPGEYEEEIGNLNNRVKQWGANTVIPKYNASTETRMENGEFPFQQVDYSQPLFDEEEGYKYGGHIMAAGGWPPGLKLKNPTLSVMPYYTNALTGVTSPSAELGLESKLGNNKKNFWTINPHIGYSYNTPKDKFPLSGGLDAKFTGLKSKNDKGRVNVDVGAGYNPAQGFGAGLEAGYKYRVFGPTNKRLGQIGKGKGALDMMPYFGAQIGNNPVYAGQGLQGKNTAFSPILGLNAEAQWRPKLFRGNAPITFFGRGDVNVNPVAGKMNEVSNKEIHTANTDTGAWLGSGDVPTNQVIPTLTKDNTSDNIQVKPNYNFTVGARIPVRTLGEYASNLRRAIPATEGGEYYQEPMESGNYTFDFRNPEIDSKGNPIPGEYTESAEDFNKRIKQHGNPNFIAPRFNADWETRQQNATLPFQREDMNVVNQEEEYDDYKYGGTMNFKYGGFNNPGFNALPKNVQAKIKARTFADGGTMPQLTEFNEGGRHEENPLGGIPQGTAGDGKVNLVEEGETKLNAANYIFSDTIKIDKGIAAAFNLAKSDVGKTFAEVSKRMNRPNSRRDNDTIEQNAKQRDLENLMLAQEGFKQIDLQKDMEMMQRKHPEMMEALQTAMSQQEQGQPSPEEMAQQGQPQMSPEEQQMMMAQQQGQMDPAMAEQMAMQQGGMPQEQMGQIPMSYGGSMFACGGKMYMNGGRMYPNGGGLGTSTYNPNWTVSQNPDAPMMNLQNLRYTYPTDARDEPIYGSRDEAKKALLNNPESDISRTYYQDRGTGKMGQLLTNAAVQDIKSGINQSWSPNFSNLPIKLKDEDTFNMTDYYYKHDATPYSGPYGVEPGLEHMSNPQYMNGGRMYGKGGQVLRSIGAGAYGVGEGLVDTLLPFMDPITDKGYDALAGIGNRSEQDLERDKMIRGFGNTAGAIGGAIVSGGAATGAAVSEGFEGLDAGLTGIKGTNKAFDDTVHSLAKVGSMAGGLVGGNPTSAMGSGAAAAQGASQVPQFAQTMMKAGQNPFLQQVTGMAGSMMQRNGGHMYPSYYPSYKNNAGPMGQGLTNTQIYNYGGGLGDPDKDRGPSKDAPKQVYNLPQVEKYYQFNPFVFPGMPTPTKGSGLSKEEKASLQILPSTTNPLTEDQRARMYGEKFKYGGSFENPRQQMYMPLDNVERMGGHLYAAGGEMDGGEPKININGTLYTKDEAIQAANNGIIASDPTELESYFAELGDNTYNNNSTTTVTPGQEEDQDEEIYPGANNANIITGGKGDYSEEDLTDEILIAEQMVKNAKNPKDKAEAEAYLSELKRADMALKDRNVNLGMKQTPLQALGLAAPAAYNIGMGLFGKPMKLNQEDFKNKSKVTPYKANIYPQLNEANLAYNSAERALKDMSPGAGAYLTNRSNLANNRAKAISSILANKENIDAQTQMQADLQNAQINANNMGNKLAIEQFNAQSKAAKQNMLGKGLEQLGQMAQNSGAMDAQERYMQLISPQYGKTFEYKTIFDQATDALKNYRKNKNSKSEENI